jgi:hypothetical protein
VATAKTVSATPDGNAIVVPTGFSTIYVLTSKVPTSSLSRYPATPSFVGQQCRWQLHRYIPSIYDADPNSANFLDLSVVQFGTTTGGDVLEHRYRQRPLCLA